MTEAADKRKALAERIASLLNAHLAGVSYAWWYRRATAPIASRNDRVLVMGDPVYYFDVLPVGVATPREPDNRIRRSEGKKVLRREDRVRVDFWYGYTDDDTYAVSTFALFELMIDSRSVAKPGVLIALEETTALATDDGGGCRVGIPSGVSIDLVPLDMEGVEFAHLLSFEVTLT